MRIEWHFYSSISILHLLELHGYANVKKTKKKTCPQFKLLSVPFGCKGVLEKYETEARLDHFLKGIILQWLNSRFCSIFKSFYDSQTIKAIFYVQYLYLPSSSKRPSWAFKMKMGLNNCCKMNSSHVIIKKWISAMLRKKWRSASLL